MEAVGRSGEEMLKDWAVLGPSLFCQEKVLSNVSRLDEVNAMVFQNPKNVDEKRLEQVDCRDGRNGYRWCGDGTDFQ